MGANRYRRWMANIQNPSDNSEILEKLDTVIMLLAIIATEAIGRGPIGPDVDSKYDREFIMKARGNASARRHQS